MAKSRGRPQIERRLVVMSPPLTEPDRRWSPDPEAIEDWPFIFPLLGLGRLIGRQGLDRDTQRLVAFSITAQVQVEGDWRDVARVDTAHEEVHLHIKSKTTGLDVARKTLFPIYGPQDVDRGWHEGETMLIGGWAEHVRRWTNGR